MKKIFKLKYPLLVLLLCALIFSACDRQTPTNDPESSSAENTVSSSNESDSVAPSVDGKLTITSESAKSYTIIRPSSAGSDVTTAAQYLQRSFNNKGFAVEYTDDWVKNTDDIPDDAYEILVGDTNRGESALFTSELRANDYTIAVDGNRIIIAGGSEKATAAAVDYFISEFITGAKDSISINQDAFVHSASYEIDELKIFGEIINRFSIVTPKNTDAITAYAAEVLRGAVLSKTGHTLNIVKEDKFKGDYAVKMLSDETLGELEYSYTSDGKILTINGTEHTLLFATRNLTAYLENASDGKYDLRPALDKVSTMDISSDYPSEPTLEGKLPVVLCDQKNAAAVVIDLLAADPTSDDAVIWKWSPNLGKNGFSGNGFANRIDEARLAYSTVLQKYVVCMTSSSGFMGIAEYPSGNKIWETNASGYGPHSIQYLPNGLVACALSGNGDSSKSEIRVYALASDGSPSQKYVSSALTSAHGVLWDNELGILWALGSKEIVAYEVGGTTQAPTLRRIDGMGTSIKSGGHDISAIPGDTGKFWIGANTVYIYDKYENKVYTDFDGSDIIASSAVKCIASHTDGSILRTVATNVYASHCTDTLAVYRKDDSGKYIKTEYRFANHAFYKARPFIAN